MIEVLEPISDEAFEAVRAEIIAAFGAEWGAIDARAAKNLRIICSHAKRDVLRWLFWATVGVLSWCALTYIAIVSDLSGFADRFAFLFFLGVSMRADRRVTQLDDLAASAIKFLWRRRDE